RVAAPRDPRADLQRIPPARQTPGPGRRPPPSHPHLRGARHGIRRDHTPGHLRGEAAGRGRRGGRDRLREAAQAARVRRAEAALPREDGRERRRPAAGFLQRGLSGLRVLHQRQLREFLMSRKTRVLLLGLVSLVAALATAAVANAGVRLNGFDFGAYPNVGATVVTSAPSKTPPALYENGTPVAGLQAVNLGRCKNVVLALDTS